MKVRNEKLIAEALADAYVGLQFVDSWLGERSISRNQLFEMNKTLMAIFNALTGTGVLPSLEHAKATTARFVEAKSAGASPMIVVQSLHARTATTEGEPSSSLNDAGVVNDV